MIRLRRTQEFFGGDIKALCVDVWNTEAPTTDISSLTAVCTLYRGNGDVELAEGAMSATGTTVVRLRRTWPAPHTTAGRYRVVAKVVYGGETFHIEWPVQLYANPGPL